MALVGALVALRLIVLPALAALEAERRVFFMGKLMPRARRTMRLSLVVLLLTGIWLGLSMPEGWALTARGAIKIGASAVLGALVWLLTLPPQRRLAHQLQPQRRLLLDLSLVAGVIVLLVSTD